MTTEVSDTLLGGVRVLDLATSRSEMAGRVLADMGAEGDQGRASLGHAVAQSGAV